MNIVFLDCEFTELQQDAQLISLALYHSQNLYFYAELTGIDYQKQSPWMKENVIEHLKFKDYTTTLEGDLNSVRMKGNLSDIKSKMSDWIRQREEIEIWADVLAYDWMLFCEIYGGAKNIPTNIFYIPFDLSTLFKVRSINPDTDRYDFVSDLLTEDERNSRHNALTDAMTGKLCYERLMQ